MSRPAIKRRLYAKIKGVIREALASRRVVLAEAVLVLKGVWPVGVDWIERCTH
jgi:hypothetical protein